MGPPRSEEHTSELQSRNDISYAVFCLKKNKQVKGRIQSAGPLRWRRLRVSEEDEVEESDGIIYPDCSFFFFFNDTATTEIYTSLHTLSLHDALPILRTRFSRLTTAVTAAPVA